LHQPAVQEDLVHRNVNDWERAASVAAGAALLYLATRQPRARTLAGSAGAGLIARGLTGYCPVSAALGREADRSDTRIALGGSRGLHVYETITIARPPGDLYRFWRDFSNLPRFMRHLEDVEVLTPTRSRWAAKAPAGMRVRWEADVINEIEGELIGWQSTGNADVASAGSVRFAPAPHGGTEIVVHLQYEPPAGRLGGWIASVFGEEPSQQIREDLRRLKALVETGEVPQTDRQPSGRASRRLRPFGVPA
jgi:uncharacterized membrane protein